MNYKDICEKAIKVVQEAGEFIIRESELITPNDIETKSLNSFVSYVDKNAEQILVSGLSKIVPQSGFITEEETIQKTGEEFNWIIDPLDGTTNFLHKVPVFSISVALNQNNETVIGIVLELNRNECFYTYKGGQVYLNGNEVKVSEAKAVKDSLVATGFPYYDFAILKNYMALIEELAQKSQGIRRLGSAAVDLAYVACGRFDIFFEHSLNPWDVAAGAFLVKQAGGIVTDFSGGNNYLFGREIISCNPHVYKEFQNMLSIKLNKE